MVPSNLILNTSEQHFNAKITLKNQACEYIDPIHLKEGDTKLAKGIHMIFCPSLLGQGSPNHGLPCCPLWPMVNMLTEN